MELSQIIPSILPHLSKVSSVGPRRLVDDSDSQSIQA